MNDLHPSRRLWLGQMLSMGALGACATPWDGKTPYTTATGFTLYPTPDWMLLSWNDPANLPRWTSLNRSMRNEWAEGLAVSAGGKYIASPIGGSPVNAITLLEVNTGKRWRLAHPNRYVKITHPAFSPDGESVAVIASPPTYGGDCEIWIAPVRGGDARVIRPDRRRSMFWPFFSWDGCRVGCFADVSPSPAGSRVKPEYQGDEFASLVEYDIATGEEAIAGNVIVSAIKVRAAYAPNDTDLLVGARIFGKRLTSSQAASFVYGAGQNAGCGPSPDFCFPDMGPIQPPPGLVEGRSLFDVRKGEAVPRFPKAARPELLGATQSRLDSSATFHGADRTGRVAISDYRKLHLCDETGIVRTLDLARYSGDPGHDNIESGAVSSDGAALAAATPLGFVDEGTRIDVLRGTEHSTFLLRPANDGPDNTVLMVGKSAESRIPE